MANHNIGSHVPRGLGTAYAPDAAGSVEDLRMSGLLEDAADLKLDGMGTAYAPDAEGSVEDLRAMHPLMGQSAEAPDAGEAIDGLREEDANIHLNGIDGAYAPGAYGDAEGDGGWPVGQRARAMRGLREEDANIVLRGLREDDAEIRMSGLREDDAQIVMRGLREDDADIALKQAMGTDNEEEALGRFDSLVRNRIRFSPGHRPLRRINFPAHLGAEDFHPRFPVEMRINGLGEIAMGGWLDFLKPLPSDTEYLAKARVVIEGWDRVRPQLQSLPEQSRIAIQQNMVAAKCDAGRYEGVRAFLAQGASAKTLGRYERMERLEAYLPTLQKMVDTQKALGQGVQNQTPTQTKQQVNKTATNDVTNRLNNIKKPNIIVDYVLPGAAITVLAGTITYVGVKAFSRK